MRKITLIMVGILMASFQCHAALVEVPTDYATIQEAVNASNSGDTIVVLPGVYYENINFRGKNVVLTSLYYLSSDTTYITSTIIDGSSPENADTASCVIFSSGEDSTAVLQGFTLTGGTGTKWTDIHGAGTYREGGGVLIELSSPSVMHNVITGNTCTDVSGVVSAGGGGIRIGDGNPEIAANRIAGNSGRYGAGIVLNYTGCNIHNNIIESNEGGQQYLGGSGIWCYGNLGATPKIITNNTIVNNIAAQATGSGGISVWSASNVMIRNNIIYGNEPALQIKTSSATPVVAYCDVQGGYSGDGNIDEVPGFEPNSYFLSNLSPCVDAGDTAASYNDIEDPLNPGQALFPSLGTFRNDMGAYGGQGASLLPEFMTLYVGLKEQERDQSLSFFYPNPADRELTVDGTGVLTLSTIQGKQLLIQEVTMMGTAINIEDLKEGIYVIRLVEGDRLLTGKIVIY